MPHHAPRDTKGSQPQHHFDWHELQSLRPIPPPSPPPAPPNNPDAGTSSQPGLTQLVPLAPGRAERRGPSASATNSPTRQRVNDGRHPVGGLASSQELGASTARQVKSTNRGAALATLANAPPIAGTHHGGANDPPGQAVAPKQQQSQRQGPWKWQTSPERQQAAAPAAAGQGKSTSQRHAPAQQAKQKSHARERGAVSRSTTEVKIAPSRPKVSTPEAGHRTSARAKPGEKQLARSTVGATDVGQQTAAPVPGATGAAKPQSVADAEARRLLISLTKVHERKNHARRIMREAKRAEQTLLHTAVRRVCAAKAQPSGTSAASAAVLASVLNPCVSVIQTFVRTALSQRVATQPRNRKASSRKVVRRAERARPTALDVRLLEQDGAASPSPARAVRDMAIQTPDRLAPPLVHADVASSDEDYVLDMVDDDAIVDETEETADDRDTVSRDDSELPGSTRHVAYDACEIPDETAVTPTSVPTQSPALNGQAVAHMIELFDAMYDADAFELRDFKTPRQPPYSAPERASAAPQMEDSMAFEANDASPTQTKLRQELAGDSFTSPLSFTRRSTS